MGGTSDRLRQRARRRAEWLASATERLEADPAVAAAWVFGSEGRGIADELSDVDLIVALVEKAAEESLEAANAMFGHYGDVLSAREVTAGTPERGRVFVVTYPAPVEALSVHWHLFPVEGLALGTDARVLVDKVVIAAADPPLETSTLLHGAAADRAAPRRAARRTERLQERVTWFWSTAPKVAKWLARGWTERAEPEVERMLDVVAEATSFLERAPTERHVESAAARPLSRLRSAVVELAALTEGLREAGIAVPSTDTAYAWLELAEDLETEGWRPNAQK